MYSIFYGDHSMTWTGLAISNSKCKGQECHSVSMKRTVRNQYLVPVLKINNIPNNLNLCTNFGNWNIRHHTCSNFTKITKKINNLFSYPSAWMYTFIHIQTSDTIKINWLWTVLPKHYTQHLQPNTLLHTQQHGYINPYPANVENRVSS